MSASEFSSTPSQLQHQSPSASHSRNDPQTPNSTSRKGILKSSPASVFEWVDLKSNIERQLVMLECLAFPGLALLSYRSTPRMDKLYTPETMEAAEIAKSESDIMSALDVFAEPGELGPQMQSQTESTRPTLKPRKSISWNEETLDNEKPPREYKPKTPRHFQSHSTPALVTLPLKWDNLSPTIQGFIRKIARPEAGDPSNPYFPLRECFICTTTAPQHFKYFKERYQSRTPKHLDEDDDTEDETSEQEQIWTE